MAAYRRVYDSRHLQADYQEPESATEPYVRQSIVGYLFTVGLRSGLYLSNFIRGSKFWLLKSTTVLMHRYTEIWKPTKSSLKVIMLLVII